MSLVERADAALYASKHAGRNRTTAAPAAASLQAINAA
jgi:PleD family two-component response regulator